MPYGTIAATGWASGLNLYATTLLLGLSGRFGWAKTPEQLQGNWVLGVAALLFIVEFFVDKIPWIDSAWDTIHTGIRPLGGALIGLALADHVGDAEIVGALLAGTFSLSAHSAKASTRALINTSPEPFSNMAASFGEDLLATVMTILAMALPVLAGVTATVLAGCSILIAWKLFKFIRHLRSGIQSRLERHFFKTRRSPSR